MWDYPPAHRCWDNLSCEWERCTIREIIPRGSPWAQHTGYLFLLLYIWLIRLGFVCVWYCAERQRGKVWEAPPSGGAVLSGYVVRAARELRGELWARVTGLWLPGGAGSAAVRFFSSFVCIYGYKEFFLDFFMCLMYVRGPGPILTIGLTALARVEPPLGRLTTTGFPRSGASQNNSTLLLNDFEWSCWL